VLERELEDTRQQNLDLQRTIEEREEELGALRKAYRRLMTERNRLGPMT
jgi:HAMP domain-containing protein